MDKLLDPKHMLGLWEALRTATAQVVPHPWGDYLLMAVPTIVVVHLAIRFVVNPLRRPK